MDELVVNLPFVSETRGRNPSPALNAGLKPATENAGFKTNASSKTSVVAGYLGGRLLVWPATFYQLPVLTVIFQFYLKKVLSAMFLFQASKILDPYPVEEEESGVD